MMGMGRPSIRPRRRFFLGCEGASERSYGALLQILADELEQTHIHLDLQDLRGGDPLAIVETAVAQLNRQIRNRGPFVARTLLLDEDKLGRNPQRDRQIWPLAERNKLLLVWQRPCHEGLLLHHLPNCQSLRPPTPVAADSHLRRHWPEYEKPMSANRLRVRIGLAELANAVTVEQELAALLSVLGFF
jgi:hypothetical protein